MISYYYIFNYLVYLSNPSSVHTETCRRLERARLAQQRLTHAQCIHSDLMRGMQRWLNTTPIALQGWKMWRQSARQSTEKIGEDGGRIWA